MVSGPGIIGGMFGLEETAPPAVCAPPFLREDSLLLPNARSGLAVLIDLLAPPRLWLPSFFCAPVAADLATRCTVLFYEVDYALACSRTEWTDAVRQNDLVVTVAYFGFPADAELQRELKERGAHVVEDACQALLTREVGRDADFVLFSPRKFVGVADGGIVNSNGAVALDGIRLGALPDGWWLKAFSALVLRREFDLYGGERRWFQLFQETEPTAPTGHYAMSELSRALLQNCFDYQSIAEKRRENYRQLAAELGDLALFPTLAEGTVPLGFPVTMRERDRVRAALFAREIFPPVHWPIAGVVPQRFRESHRLAKEIMTLPCDQRYGEEEMERMIAIVKKEVRQ